MVDLGPCSASWELGKRCEDEGEEQRSTANSHGRVSRRHRSFDLLSLESITTLSERNNGKNYYMSLLFVEHVIFLVWPVDV